MKNSALGRGLSSLLREEIVPVQITRSEDTLPIEQIEPNGVQPRKIFDQSKIQELANSIVNNGLVQPIVVNKLSSGKYRIIAGERRYRACALVGIKNIPVIVKNLTPKEELEIALIENIQRQELTAIEEAEGYHRLIKEFGYTQNELANNLGKSRSHVTNLLRLNQLPTSVKDMINNGQLSMGHARCLIGNEDAEILAQKIVDNGLNVRQAEDLTKRRQRDIVERSVKEKPQADDDLIILGHTLSERFGVKVVIENSWQGGKISFHYSNLEELDAILMKMN